MKIPDILKSRVFAFSLLAAVVLISTPLGARASLKRASNNVEEGFYNGVYIEDGDYTSGSIASYLSDASRAALGLITIGTNHAELTDVTDRMRTAREDLLGANSIGDKYAAYHTLSSAFDSFMSIVSDLSLTDSEGESVEIYSELFIQSREAIGRNPYNSSVQNFITEVFQRFPADIIASIFSIDAPESFGGNT